MTLVYPERNDGLSKEAIEQALAKIRFALNRNNAEEARNVIDELFRANTPEQLTLDSPIALLGLALRTVNYLEGAGYRTIGQLRNTSDAMLLLIENFGPKQVLEVREALRRVPSL